MYRSLNLSQRSVACGIREECVWQSGGGPIDFAEESEIALFYCWQYGYWQLEIFPDRRVILAISD